MRWTVNSDLIRLISLLKLGGGGGGVDSIKGGASCSLTSLLLFIAV